MTAPVGRYFFVVPLFARCAARMSAIPRTKFLDDIGGRSLRPTVAGSIEPGKLTAAGIKRATTLVIAAPYHPLSKLSKLQRDVTECLKCVKRR